MRVFGVWRLLSMGAVALALSACGNSGSNSSSQSSASSGSETAPAAAAAPNLTGAQTKALLAELPPAYQSADLSNGEAKFAVCRSCHTVNKGGEDMTGPNLWGVFGRKAGSEPGFAYSDGMKTAGWTWDADRINQWITNPRAVLPDTKMTFIGMSDPTDRRDVIAFLKTQTSPPPKS